MFWNFIIRDISARIVNKVFEKNSEKLNSSLNMWQRQREKNKFAKMYYKKILKKYGNSLSYDNVLRFILKNNIIDAIFENHSSMMNKTKGDQNLIFYYTELYKEQSNNSSEDTLFAKKILYDLYYEILAFNLSSVYISPEEKIISNQNVTSQNIIHNLEKMNEGIDDIKSEVTYKQKKNTEYNLGYKKNYYLDKDKLNEYKKKLLSEYQIDNYISREIESLDGLNITMNLYQLLKEKNKITLTGEAGIGKSTEARNIFRKFADEAVFQNHIPIYLNLAHYGVLYNSLKEGINQILSEFIQLEESSIDTILSEQTLIIVLDGLDEINDDNRIDKAIAELNNLSFKFNDNYYLSTIRENQINNRIDKEIVYKLMPFNYSQLISILRENNMLKDFDKNYTELFKNPLFLNLAINLYSVNNRYGQLNKSDLIEAIILDLLTNVSKKFNASRILDLLASFSYKFFNQNSFTHLSFEEYFEREIDNSKTSRFIINSLIQSNIFKVNEFTIEFTYKTFKDYFCSKYLLNEYKKKENFVFLKEYLNRNEWEESLIYLVGLIGDLDSQTNLLNIYMETNLSLYVKSVESKNNLYEELEKLSLNDYIKKLGMDFLGTYEYILKKYFSEIASLLYPLSSLRKDKNFEEFHQNLVMYITEDKKNVSYFLRLVSVTENKLDLVTDLDDFRNLYRKFHNDFSIQTTIKTQTKNLEHNNLTGDSGRLLAIKHLKSELNELIENHGLHHSAYIFFDKLKSILRKVDIVNELDNMDEIINKLEKYLLEFNNDSLGIDIFDTGLILGDTQIDIVKLYKSLLPFRHKDINFSDYRFIERDIDYSESKGYTWSVYSINKRKEIIRRFFEVGNSSVHQMFNDNFPALIQYLLPTNLVPYRTDVYIENNLIVEEDTSLTYVDVPVENKEQIKTKIFEVEEKQRNFESIQKKYKDYSYGKKPTKMTSTSFQYLCLSGRSLNNSPVTDYVYEEIRLRLESILGTLK